jgi:hypothetical protein
LVLIFDELQDDFGPLSAVDNSQNAADEARTAVDRLPNHHRYWAGPPRI